MDAERRAAERAVRADPHDPASARGLAEALRRSGDRRALFHALCALARAGDAEAAAEVEAWHPWPGPDGRGNRRAGVGRPVRDPVRTRVARLPVGVPRAIAGASATHLFVVCAPPGWTPTGNVPGEVLVAVDLATLEVAWQVASSVARTAWQWPAVLVGEEVAWGTGEAVRVVSARDGGERLRVPLELGSVAEDHALWAVGDRVVAWAQDQPGDLAELAAIDLNTGTVAWRRRDADAFLPSGAFAEGVFVDRRGGVLTLDDGLLIERAPGLDGAERVARLDDGDQVAILRSPLGDRRLTRVDPSGRTRWTQALPDTSARDQLAVLGDYVVTEQNGPGDVHGVIRTLGTGESVWNIRANESEDGPLPVRSVVGSGDDAVLLVAGARRSELERIDPALSTWGDDLVLDLPLLVRPPWRDIARVDFAELVALDGALLVVATGDEGDLVLARVDGPAVASVDGPAVASVDGPAVASVDGPAVASVDGPAVASVDGPAVASGAGA